MREAVMRKARESAREVEGFFDANAERVEACARAIAARLEAGGRLYTFGNGGSSCDAQHAAVEFLHPIVEKRRAFAAIALAADAATMTAIGNDTDFSRVYADQIKLLARPGDVALGISTSGSSANVVRGLSAARERELCTVALAGKDGGRIVEVADHAFVVPSFSIHRIQEVHGVLLHVLWDLVHVALGEEDVL